MKKILAFVLTLAMMLTLLNVGFISTAAKTADGPIVAITDQATVTVEGTEYTVIDALPTTAGNYILKQDVVATAGYTFPAGVVLHGNGYTITLQGNTAAAPATAAPFKLPAGAEDAPATVVITNVNFGTATAPIYLKADELRTDLEKGNVATTARKDIGLFENDGAEYGFAEDATSGAITEGEQISNFVNTTFENVTFNVSILALEGESNVGGVMGTVYGNHTLRNCTMNANINAGDANAETRYTTSEDVFTYNHAGLYYGRVLGMGSVDMAECSTTASSTISNNFRVGGFIGFVDAKGTAALRLVSCENNAKIAAAGPVVGGFVAYIAANYSNNAEGELLIFDDLTNNGDIYSNLPVANYGAGGIVGHIYYNKSGQDTDYDATITLNHCVNYGTIYTKGYAGGIVCMSRVGKRGYEAEKGVMIYNNCINYGIIEDTLETGNATTKIQNLKGGITARSYGAIHMTNCKNYGSILNGDNGNSGDQIGGFIGGTYTPQVPTDYTGDFIKLTNCDNYGAIMSGRRVGGFSGTGEVPMLFENCVNYGSVGDCSVDAGNGQGGVGGFVGYGAPNGAYRCDLTFKNCANFGSTSLGTAAGGFVGSSYDSKFENCINVANLDGGGQVGGFVGGHRSGPLVLKDCANVGSATGLTTGSGGNVVGQAESASVFTLENFLSYGMFTMFEDDPKLAGIIGHTSTVEPTEADDADFFAEVLTAEEPDSPALEWQDSAEDAAEKANAMLAALGLPEVVYANADGTLMVFNPMLRGIQSTEAVDGKMDIRILGAVDGNMPFYEGIVAREYDTVVLKYKMVEYSSDEDLQTLLSRIEAATQEQVDMLLYESINNVIGYDELLQEKQIETITNYDMAAQFIGGGVIKDVEVTDSDDEAIVIVANMTTVFEGVEYDSASYLFLVVQGEVLEVMPFDALANG